MGMVVLDDDGTSSGDSSSTLMDSFSRRGKSRVLQIGDDWMMLGKMKLRVRRGQLIGPGQIWIQMLMG